MKKFLVALVIFATLPFSSTHSIDRETTIYGAGIVLAAAGTYYIYNYVAPVPNDTNATAPKPTLSDVLAERDQKFADYLQKYNSRRNSTTPTTDNSGNDTPKLPIIPAPTKEKNITETTTPTTTESKTESNFLNNIHDSLKKIDLERLLLENMDVLEG